MTTRERVRVKTGLPVDADFAGPLGTPIVIDDTQTTGGLYYMDAAGNPIRVAGPFISTYPFTPGLSFGGGTTGITYANQNANATKIGPIVIASGYIALTAKGSSTGSAKITGLPFTVRNDNDSYSPPSFYIVNITFTGQMQGFVDINATTITLAQCTEAGVASTLTDTNFANNSTIRFLAIYRTEQ